MKRDFIHWSYFLLLIIVGVFFLSGCKKDEIQLPQLNTLALNEITVKTAKGGGKITFDGGNVISTCGLCWNLNHSPSIKNYKTIDTLQN